MAGERRGRSVTAFVEEALARKVAEEDAALLCEAFTLVGEDFHEANIEFARDAQRGVALKGE
jgi:hypothetical protein